MFNSWRIDKEGTSSDKEKSNNSNTIPVSYELLKNLLSGSNDITFREVNINSDDILILCYIDGLVDVPLIDETILKPIINQKFRDTELSIKNIYSNIENGLIYHASYKMQENINDCIEGILNGNVCVIGNKKQTAILFEVKGFEKRGIRGTY